MLLAGVDRAAFAAALAVRLREKGVPVGFTGIESFTRALEAAPPGTLSDLYWTARISLVRRRTEIEIFDEVFTRAFGAAGPAMDPHARRRPLKGVPEQHAPLPSPAKATGEDPGGLPWTTLPAMIAAADGEAGEPAVPERLATDAESLANVPFEELGPGECELLGRWLEEAVTRWPVRRSRRRKVGTRGRAIAVRATLARSRRTGWVPLDLSGSARCGGCGASSCCATSAGRCRRRRRRTCT